MKNLAALLAATLVVEFSLAAQADSSDKTHCYWDSGVYACSSTYESPYSTTKTICASGGIDAACSTKTKLKEPPPPPAPLPLAREQASGGTLILRGSNAN